MLSLFCQDMSSELEIVLNDVEANKDCLSEVEGGLKIAKDPAIREELLGKRLDILEETNLTLQKRALALTPQPVQQCKKSS